MTAFLSCMVSAKYEKYNEGEGVSKGFKKPAVLPELTCFSFAYNKGGLFSVEAGRVEYTDVFGQTASGLFDGIRFQDAAGDEKLNSQYVQFLVEIFNKKDMRILGGFVYERMQSMGGNYGSAKGNAFGALASVEMGIPGYPNNSVKISAKYSSGPYDGRFTGFVPLTSTAQGMVYSGIFSGLWLARLDYEVRLLPSMYYEASVSLFGKGYYEPDVDGVMLGGEMWNSFAWRPYEDVQVNFGGGLFIPGQARAYSVGRNTTYRVSAGVMVSF